MAVNVDRDPLSFIVQDDVLECRVGLYAAFGALINATWERTLVPLRAVRHDR